MESFAPAGVRMGGAVEGILFAHFQQATVVGCAFLGQVLSPIRVYVASRGVGECAILKKCSFGFRKMIGVITVPEALDLLRVEALHGNQEPKILQTGFELGSIFFGGCKERWRRIGT